ncbi:AAA family ATPase [Helicobacter fennelliae]|uniref:AAA family ATPase n=1 Tax=Helicobacter fennelliae TaxID=215 RepID=UPI000E00E260|nr:AAA family ATPase [Helicobacter fennelliae]STQ83832.1 ATPase [Helicobacter fennelliae]
MIDFTHTFYEKTKNFSIFPRSSMPKNKKLLLYGPPRSGKTSIALELANSAKKVLYIDGSDIRFRIAEAQSTLLKLFLEKRFDFLIIDNFSPNIPLPNTSNIILITPQIAHLPESILSTFTIQKILPLTFQEYVSFTKKSLSLESIFSNFLKEGNIPEIPFLPEFKKLERNQEIVKLRFSQDLNIFCSLLSYQAQKFSIYNFYTILKQHTKISKDRIYHFIQTLDEEGIIAKVPHISANQPQKLYFYNFALPYFISAQPNFQAIFENLIYCELARSATSIYYDEYCDFLVDDCVYCATPFPTQHTIAQKLSQIQSTHSTIKKIIFITIKAQEPQTPPHHKYSIINFIDFALNDE